MPGLYKQVHEFKKRQDRLMFKNSTEEFIFLQWSLILYHLILNVAPSRMKALWGRIYILFNFALPKYNSLHK